MDGFEFFLASNVDEATVEKSMRKLLGWECRAATLQLKGTVFGVAECNGWAQMFDECPQSFAAVLASADGL